MRFPRINFIFILIFLFWAVIIAKLFFIQIQNYSFYKALAQGQQKLITQIQGRRGEIFLKDGQDLKPLAVNRTWPFIYAWPTEIKNKEEVADRLGQILNLEKEEILEKIKNEESLFVILKQKLTEEEVQNLKKSNLSGIYLGEEKLRDYPLESFASHLLGFFGGEKRGQYGLEDFYNEILEGEEGILEGERIFGKPLIFSNFSPDKEGSDLILTIDYNVQFMAEKLLKEAKEKFEIEEGQIIVIDPDSGKVFALAHFPSFNPNNYFEEKDFEIFKNGAIQKIFEPGSVFKPIVIAAALNEEKITPQTTYYDEGFVKIGGETILNYGGKIWGQRTMTEVLEKSINTGAIFAERQVGHDLFLKYIEKFGFFEKTGIDLQGEIFSQNEEFKKGYEINFATASFGQGIGITPIQLVRAFCAIANGGKLVKPYLVDPHTKQGQGAEGAQIDEVSPYYGVGVISPRTSNQLTAMLVSVVENGFGKAAKIPGYFIAGKTGTGQIPWSSLGIEKKGYSEKTIQTFVGYAPAFNPKFLILVKFDNPNTKTAEYSAVPIFRELAEYIIHFWQIPPDYAQ